jgi:hypothetical protein
MLFPISGHSGLSAVALPGSSRATDGPCVGDETRGERRSKSASSSGGTDAACRSPSGRCDRRQGTRESFRRTRRGSRPRVRAVSLGEPIKPSLAALNTETHRQKPSSPARPHRPTTPQTNRLATPEPGRFRCRSHQNTANTPISLTQTQANNPTRSFQPRFQPIPPS